MMPKFVTSYLRPFSLSLGLAFFVGMNTVSISSARADYWVNLPQTIAQNDPEGGNMPEDLDNTNDDRDIIIDDRPTNQPPDESNEGNTPSVTTAEDSQSRFGCDNVRGESTVMYYPESQAGVGYAWAIPSQLGGGWTPAKRCAEIARRLELYRPDGLVELSNSTENGYNIVCVTTEKDPSCRIVLTVPPGQDPQTTRDRVFQNIITADSGETTTGVSTYSGGGSNQALDQIGEAVGLDLSNLGLSQGNRSTTTSTNINLKPYLDRADGGTGEKLDRVPSNRPNSKKLNPNNFR
jgi:hypothetical protein